MPLLVAIDLPGGTRFVDALRRIWDRGDAVLPLDQRLPLAAKEQLLVAMGVDAVVDRNSETIRPGGKGCEAGDALVICTSGSSGAPKGVVLTHDAVIASAEASSTRLDATAADHWLACLPLSHVGGLSVVTRALHRGATLTVLPGFEPAAVRAAVDRGANLTSLVATTLQRVDPTPFRCILVGGGAAPTHLPDNAVVTYGMTETGSGVVYDGEPLPGVEVRIGRLGEILVRGPMLLRSYRDGTTPIDAAGWLHTGDLGHWARDGRLVVEGRRGDLIITGGENVWPDQVEAVLSRHPQIGEVAVAGVADREWGQIITAFVVPADRLDPPALEALRTFVKLSLPGFMAPRALVLRDRLPRTALGKIRRSELGL